MKLFGDGFALHPSSFDVSLAPGEPPRLLRFQGDAAAPARYALYDLALAPGFVGALAVEGRDAELEFRGPADLDERRGCRVVGARSTVRELVTEHQGRP